MKILVGCPTYKAKKYCWKLYSRTIKNLDYDNYDILVVDNSESNEYFDYIKKDVPAIKDEFLKVPKDRLVHSRNILRQKVLDEGYDYFLCLEQDVIPAPDVIKRLISHNKKIVGGIVIHRKTNPDTGEVIVGPMLWKHFVSDKKMRYVTKQELQAVDLLEIDVCSLSCLLIHRDVLEKVKFRYEKGFDDMMFCKDAKDAGFKIYVDTNVKPKHYPKKWIYIEDTGEVLQGVAKY